MWILILVLISLAVCALVAKFAKQVIGMTFIFIGGIGLSIIVAFFDFKLATAIFAYSLVLGFFMWLLIGISGFISAAVLVPLASIWFGLKLFFERLFK